MTNKLETAITKRNLRHRLDNEAIIMYKPVPLIVTAKGIVAKQSTVDFEGAIRGGIHICFDTKETHNKTSFPMANIKEHQIAYLTRQKELGSIAFMMVQFVEESDELVFIVPMSKITEYYGPNIKRKSIPRKDFSDAWKVSTDLYLTKVQELFKTGVL